MAEQTVYYTITPCCDYLGVQLDYFTFPLLEIVQDGLYRYDGDGVNSITVNGIIFVPGYCYEVFGQGLAFGLFPFGPSISDFTPTGKKNCDDPPAPGPIQVPCTPCEPSPPAAYKYYTLNDCCTNVPISWPFGSGFEGVIYLEFDGISCNIGNFNNVPCPNDLINLVITQLNNEANIVITGCLNLTSVSITEIPVGADIGEWENIVQEVSVVPTCEECPDFDCFGCFILEDCAGIAESIYSLDSALASYVNGNQSIMITGSDVCWRVLVSDEPCECAISTTISYVYDDCEACTERKGYKLTECTTGAIIYTTTDLSEYINDGANFNVISIDCPGCWYIEPIDFIPPTDQPVIFIGEFESCELCNATYYELVDCTGIKDPIITIDDLSDYVGKVINIKYCPETCWEVNLTTPQPISGEVIFEEEFDDCTECLINVLPVKCYEFLLTGDSLEGDLTVWLPNGTEESIKLTETILPSIKGCYLTWIKEESIEVKDFGLCIDNECPLPPRPKRQVTPGYNTPVCSTEYYEKVECNFSDWTYKDVLNKRYGISNCCPEELMKWEIKHEMLMLDVLINPDYDCTPITTCNCPVIGGFILNTACPEVTNYILERCNEPEITEVVRIDNQYTVLGNVIVIDEQCYTVVSPTNRLVTVYWVPDIIYVDCSEAGCPPIKFTCNPITSCSSYSLLQSDIDAPYPGNIHYLDCNSIEKLLPIDSGDNLTTVICGVVGQTSNTIYYQPDNSLQPFPGVISFQELNTACGALSTCIEDPLGQYDTLDDCELSCGDCTINVFDYITNIVIETHLETQTPIALVLTQILQRGLSVDNGLICCPNCERYVIGRRVAFEDYVDTVIRNDEVITCCTNSTNELPYGPPEYVASSCDNGFNEAILELIEILPPASKVLQNGIVESGSINIDGSTSITNVINMLDQFFAVDNSISLENLYDIFLNNGLVITCQPCPGYQSSGTELWIGGLPKPLEERQELCNE